MRVIAGTAKGRRLKAPKGMKTRPTSDRVKEAVFNILSPYVGQARFLDLFAGSGAMGIEALSRGASTATFVENDKAALNVIKTNIRNCGFTDFSRVIPGNVFSVLRKLQGEQFDLIYVDPPYSTKLGTEVLTQLIDYQLLTAGSLVMVETRRADHVTVDISELKQVTVREYGDTAVCFFEMLD